MLAGLGEALAAFGADAQEGLQSGVGGWGSAAGQDGGLDPAYPGLVSEGPDYHAVAVDDDGQVVREGDAFSGGDESLDLDGFVAAAGE